MNTVDTRVNGVRVLVTEKTAIQSSLLLAKLVKYFGTGLVQVIDSLKDLFTKDIKSISDLINQDVRLDGFIIAINDIGEKLEPEIFVSLLQEITSGVRVQHITNASEMIEVNVDTFDSVFTGRTKLMFQITFLVLKVNFGDFFGDGGIGTTPVVPVSPTPTSKKK